MKKRTRLAILIMIVLTLTGCGNKVESNPSSKATEIEDNRHIIVLDEDPYVGPAITDDIYEDFEDEAPYITPTDTNDMYGVFENQIDIYNSAALNEFLGTKHIVIDDIKEAVDNNNNLDSWWKDTVKDFAERITNEYPEIDMRLFYENCKRLTIEYDPYESLGGGEDNRLAFYDCEDGSIHVQEDINYESTYNLMIIRHELGHMISLGIIKRDPDKKIVCITNNGDYGFFLREAIDVIISSRPYEEEYYSTDFGYGTIANELEAVIVAIPDFDISVLANQDVYNIADYLQDVNPNSVSASRFITLMEHQAAEYYGTDKDESVPEDYTDIYRYIANTYVNHVLNDNMSSEEIQLIRDSLYHTLTKNLYSYQLVGTEEIDNVFNEYMAIHE